MHAMSSIMPKYCALGIVCACSWIVGCSTGSRMAFQFEAPRILLHAYEDSAGVRGQLRSEGPMIRDGGNPILIAGTGTIRWGSRPIVVAKDGIKIDGVPVESLPEGHRNAVIDKDGTIRKDRFIPFEPWWGIHSSWW